MSKRTVFGRRKLEFGGRKFTIEMREDGIYVRRKHCRDEWKLPLDRLINHAQNQPELIYDDQRQPEMFVEQGNQKESVSDLPEGFLVPGQPASTAGPVHESGEPKNQGSQNGGDGVVPFIKQMVDDQIHYFKSAFASDPGVPADSEPLENPDPTPATPGSCLELGSQPEQSESSGGNLGSGTPSLGVPDEGRE